MNAGLPSNTLSAHIEKRVNQYLERFNCGAGYVTVRVLASSDRAVEVRPAMKARFQAFILLNFLKRKKFSFSSFIFVFYQIFNLELPILPSIPLILILFNSCIDFVNLASFLKHFPIERRRSSLSKSRQGMNSASLRCMFKNMVPIALRPTKGTLILMSLNFDFSL